MKTTEIENLEWYESGDGTEYEIWIDTSTNQLYKVPIEILRNFTEKEPVDSIHQAKFNT